MVKLFVLATIFVHLLVHSAHFGHLCNCIILIDTSIQIENKEYFTDLKKLQIQTKRNFFSGECIDCVKLG